MWLVSVNVRRFGDPTAPPVVCVAGFADHGGMFEPLGPTALGRRFSLVGVDLPGTGQSPPMEGALALQAAAQVVADVVTAERASILVGHSVGSIVASLAALRPASPVDTVVSIEGNLTAADAYFSGSAAGYGNASAFHLAFLERLDRMANGDPTLRRYRDQVAAADPQSIWELGCDTYAWSRTNHPGEVLLAAAENVRYLYNPANMPPESVEWLHVQPVNTVRLDGASHWKMVDQTDLMASKLLEALAP